jgi:hypothetical protein
MGKLPVLVTQSHGVLTCACDCVANNACLPLPAEIKPPQTPQNFRDDGKSSAAISRTDLTLRVRYFPHQPRTPVLPRRPPDLRSTSYPAGRTCWHLQMPVCHHRVTMKKIPMPRRCARNTPAPGLPVKGSSCERNVIKASTASILCEGSKGDRTGGGFAEPPSQRVRATTKRTI